MPRKHNGSSNRDQFAFSPFRSQEDEDAYYGAKIPPERDLYPPAKATIHNEDCITGMPERLTENSVDLVVTSIPFGALFMYSGKTEDIGNNSDGIDLRAGMFGLHMRFFIEQLFRVVKPGCNVCQALSGGGMTVVGGYFGQGNRHVGVAQNIGVRNGGSFQLKDVAVE